MKEKRKKFQNPHDVPALASKSCNCFAKSFLYPTITIFIILSSVFKRTKSTNTGKAKGDRKGEDLVRENIGRE